MNSSWILKFLWNLFPVAVVSDTSFWWQDDFVLGKKLGEGSFGVVYRVSLANKASSKVLLYVLIGSSWNFWKFTRSFVLTDYCLHILWTTSHAHKLIWRGPLIFNNEAQADTSLAWAVAVVWHVSDTDTSYDSCRQGFYYNLVIGVSNALAETSVGQTI